VADPRRWAQCPLGIHIKSIDARGDGRLKSGGHKDLGTFCRRQDSVIGTHHKFAWINAILSTTGSKAHIATAAGISTVVIAATSSAAMYAAPG